MKRGQFSKNNKATLVTNGQEFIDAFAKLVSEAKEKVLFHTYIFTYDECTRPAVDALITKAKEGVPVYVLLDAFGTPELHEDLKREFRDAGILWSYFAPVRGKRFEHIGRRLHQKVLVIDNDKSMLGGINLSKQFIAPDNGRPWLDYAVIIEGEEVFGVQKKIFRLYRKYFPEHADKIQASIRKSKLSYDTPLRARTLENDFMRFKSEIRHGYLRAINNAEKSIRLTATYFLPGKKLMRALKKASKRGVEIELIFSEVSDVKLERWSSRHLYTWYLSNNFKIYEWSESIVHAKAAVIDGKWSTIGSYNHNYISRYACLEMNVEIENDEFAQKMEREFQSIRAKAKVVERESWKETNRTPLGLLYYLSYLVSSLITVFSMVFITQKKEKIDFK